jgi:hypothetical protein
MININVLFLDLDGVIRDWVRGVHDIFIDAPMVEYKTYGSVCKHICKALGISKSYFWELMNENFWVELKFYPWADDVIALLPYDMTCILTSPTLNSAGWNQQWIRENIPNYFNDKKYLIGPGKRYCAADDALLIDDCEQNVHDFVYDGGHAILFPQTWNKNREYCSDRIGYLQNELLKYQIGGLI